jgi:hypothetical protein
MPPNHYVEAALSHMLGRIHRIEEFRWYAKCPVHDDKKPSLAIWYDRQNGYLSFKCYAGCSSKQVTDHLYTMYPEYSDILGRSSKAEKMDFGSYMQNDSVGAKKWFASYLGLTEDAFSGLPISFTSNEIIFRFDGTSRYRVRIQGEKTISWRGGDGHAPDLWPVPPQSMGEDILITEGETDCIIARHLGFEAYGITKGAGAGLSPQIFASLRRRGVRRVVVCMDADQAGRKAASAIAIAARQAGLGAIDLDLVAEGLVEPFYGQKDLRDAFLAGRGHEIVEAIRHMLYMADGARPRAPRPLSEIMVEEVDTDFIWDGVLPAGGVAILAAPPKIGKSHLVLDLALAISEGREIFGHQAKKGRVIYYALEDGENIIRQRVRRRGLTGYGGVYVATDSPIMADDDVSLLEEHIEQIDPVLVIIDTLRATNVGKDKSENEAGYADVVYRIGKVARERGVAVLIVHHTTKAQTGSPVADVRGSSAIAGAVDVIMGMYQNGEEVTLRWLGRYGAGEVSMVQGKNGSFVYFSDVPETKETDMNERMRRTEERLAKYEEACRKHADPKTGRIYVSRVVGEMWPKGADGKYAQEHWVKTYKALDELVKRRVLNKRDKDYFLVHLGAPQKNGQAGPQLAEVQKSVQAERVEDVKVDMQGQETSGKLLKVRRSIEGRKMLAEILTELETIAAKGGDRTKKAVLIAHNAIDLIKRGKLEEAMELCQKADYDLSMEIYDLELEAEKRGEIYMPDNDVMQADYVLYLGYFAALFGQASPKEREIGWILWDNRGNGDIRVSTISFFKNAVKYMRLLGSGMLEGEARREVMRFIHTAENRIMMAEVLDYVRTSYFGANASAQGRGEDDLPTDAEVIAYIDEAMDEHDRKGGTLEQKLAYLNAFLERFRHQLLEYGRVEAVAYIERKVTEIRGAMLGCAIEQGYEKGTG